MGLSSVDCTASGVEPFSIHSLRSLCVRYFSQGQKQAMFKALQNKSSNRSCQLEPGQRSAVNKRATQDGSNLHPAKKTRGASSTGIGSSSIAGSCHAPVAHDDGVETFLRSLQLHRFAPRMAEEQVDMESLHLLSDQDLISLGIPLGPRRKLQAALRKVARH